MSAKEVPEFKPQHCSTLTMPPKTLGELFEISGHDDSVLRANGAENELTPGGTFFLASQDPLTILTCRCGYLSDLACDWPMGDGKTCDLPLCKACSKGIGDDEDLCLIHWRLFETKSSIMQIFPSGPRIVK